MNELKKDKICTKCKVLKPRSEFYPLGKHITSECKKCMIERATQFRKDNIETYRKSKRAYVAKNPKKWSKYAKKYQKEHKERIAKAVLIRYFLKELKEKFAIDLGKYSIAKKTYEEMCQYHKYLKELCEQERKHVVIT